MPTPPCGPLRIERTSVEYAQAPLGSDVARPRLSWVCAADGHAAEQSAYQVLVASDPADLEPGRADVWDSGRIASDESVGVEYDGPDLRPRTRYHWRVRVWDRHDRPSEWSQPQWWETALLGEAWTARWIGGGPDDASERPAPLLRREFGLDRPVTGARLYVCGLAYQEIHLNGVRVGSAVLDPGFTAYDDTVLYRTYDVTDLLTDGANAIGVELGRGFFGLTTPNEWRWHRPPWHGEPRLLAQLEVDHPDGSRTVVGSDETWRVADGPTVSDSLYAGETYDARREQPGWTRPGFDDSAWRGATPLAPPPGRLTAQQHEPIEVADSIVPVAVTADAPGSYVVDLGRTMAGWARVTVDEPAGTRVSLRYGERLDADGRVEAANQLVAGDRFQVDKYICAGRGRETWEPRFTYKGFRYVQVDGPSRPPAIEDVVGRLVHSGLATVGTFGCSEPAYERLDRAMRRTLLNNLHGIPTDTPMYEKNGWTGDAHVGVPTMTFCFNMARFLAKWAGDLAASQIDSGQLPVIVPSAGWGYAAGELAPSPEWTTVYPYLIREIYRCYGDRRVVEEHWAHVSRYVDWELDRREDGIALTALGDWVAPGHQEVPPEDPRLTATAYLYRSLLATAELADLLGHTDQATRYREAAAESRDALNATFLDREAGYYRTDRDPDYRQTSNAVPLAFGLVPDQAVPSVVASLVDDIRARGDHLNTGCLGTSVLLPVLTSHGHADVARAIATQTTYPSWGYWFENGADTLWEMWELDSRSRDHYFLGTASQWLYENVAGLRPGDDGYARFVVRPDARHGLTWAAAELDTVRGPIAVAWRQSDGALALDVTVPVGATAEVCVPSAGGPDGVRVEPDADADPVRVEPGFAVFAVGHGQWRFTSDQA